MNNPSGPSDKMVLSPEHKELLLYVDNTQEIYNRLQKINQDTIKENLFYNKWYIEQNSTKLKAQWSNYFQFLKNAFYAYKKEIDQENNYLPAKMKNKDFEILAKYLYLREIENMQETYQTGLDALTKMVEIIGGPAN